MHQYKDGDRFDDDEGTVPPVDRAAGDEGIDDPDVTLYPEADVDEGGEVRQDVQK